MAVTDPQAQVRGRAAPGGHAASLCSAGRPIPREGARTPVALKEYACRAAHLLPSPEQRDESTYGVAVVLALLGVLLLAAPDLVPALTIPGDHAMPQMDQMKQMGS